MTQDDTLLAARNTFSDILATLVIEGIVEAIYSPPEMLDASMKEIDTAEIASRMSLDDDSLTRLMFALASQLELHDPGAQLWPAELPIREHLGADHVLTVQKAGTEQNPGRRIHILIHANSITCQDGISNKQIKAITQRHKQALARMTTVLESQLVTLTEAFSNEDLKMDELYLGNDYAATYIARIRRLLRRIAGMTPGTVERIEAIKQMVAEVSILTNGDPDATGPQLTMRELMRGTAAEKPTGATTLP